jgi:hypothetical protein
MAGVCFRSAMISCANAHILDRMRWHACFGGAPARDGLDVENSVSRGGFLQVTGSLGSGVAMASRSTSASGVQVTRRSHAGRLPQDYWLILQDIADPFTIQWRIIKGTLASTKRTEIRLDQLWVRLHFKTRVSVASNASRPLKKRLCVPFLRVCCHSRSVGFNSGE